jgi:WD40 repeat protein
MDGMIEAQEASVCSAANPNGVPSGDALHSIESNGADLSMAENEPRLSYAAFGADVPAIVAADSVTRLCVSDKVLALGTESGQVHILDLEGNKVPKIDYIHSNNIRVVFLFCIAPRQASYVVVLLLCLLQIKTYTEHTTAITDLSFDENAENLASSSSDGSIVVVGLYSDEVRCFPSSHPVTVSLLCCFSTHVE